MRTRYLAFGLAGLLAACGPGDYASEIESADDCEAVYAIAQSLGEWDVPLDEKRGFHMAVADRARELGCIVPIW